MKNQPLCSVAARVEQAASAALILLAFGFAFDWKTPILRVQGLAVTSVELLVLIVIGLWVCGHGIVFFKRTPAAHAAEAQRYPAQLVRSWGIPVLAWGIVLLAATAAAPSNQITALKFTVKVISSVMIGWIVFDLTKSWDRQQLVVRILALSGLTVALIGVMEAANFAPLNAWLSGFRFNTVTFAGIPRISATLVHPNHLAMILELTLPLALAWFLTERRKWVQPMLGIGMFGATLALVLTLSRGGLIAMLAGFGLMAVIAAVHAQRRVALGSLAIIGTLIILATVTVIVNPLLWVRVVSPGSNELWYRAEYQVPRRLSTQPGGTLIIPVTITNTGLLEWEADGSRPFNLSYHIILLDDGYTSLDEASGVAGSLLPKKYVVYEGVRTSLPELVVPDKQVNLSAEVIAPSEPGSYVIEWDIIQESVTWFSEKNAVPGCTHLTVLGIRADSAPPNFITPAAETPLNTPGRLVLWMTAGQMFWDRPLLGVGPHTYQENYSIYTQEERFAPHAHNLWLGWLAETGILGFLAFLWMTGWFAQIVWRGRHLYKRDKSVWIWWLACLTGITSLLVHGFVDSPYSDASVYLGFWIVAGLILSMVQVWDEADDVMRPNHADT